MLEVAYEPAPQRVFDHEQADRQRQAGLGHQPPPPCAAQPAGQYQQDDHGRGGQLGREETAPGDRHLPRVERHVGPQPAAMHPPGDRGDKRFSPGPEREHKPREQTTLKCRVQQNGVGQQHGGRSDPGFGYKQDRRRQEQKTPATAEQAGGGQKLQARRGKACRPQVAGEAQRFGDDHGREQRCGTRLVASPARDLRPLLRWRIGRLDVRSSGIWEPHETNLNTDAATDKQSPLEHEVAVLAAEALQLEIAPGDIPPQARLFGDGLGLDSIDALELSLALSRRYGIELKSDDDRNGDIFASLRALSAHVAAHRTR